MSQSVATIAAPGEVLPDVLDLLCASPDEVAAWAAEAPLTDGVPMAFGVLDPSRLSQDGAIDAVQALDRLISWAHAQQARILAAAAADPDPFPAPKGRQEHYAQLSLCEEIACGTRWSPAVTTDRIRTAVVLSSRLPRTLALLSDGRISYRHARSLADAARDLDPTVAARLETRVLRRAATQTLSEFRRVIRTGLTALDARAVEQKHTAAAQDRRVAYQPDENAMAWVNCRLPAADAQTVFTAIQAVADKGSRTRPDDLGTADQWRADALTAICAAVLDGRPIDGLGEVASGLPQWQGRRPSIQVTVALSTLAGLDDQPGELDGYGPIPASLARRIAADPTGTWRRLVTDPTGRLVDRGRSTYRPPADLREFVIARDRTCRGIGCGRCARRCELDHETDFADGGATNDANLGAKCARDHHLKHDAGWDVRRLPDGTTRWVSPTGRTYDKPPNTYPLDRARPRARAGDDPPPF